MTDMDVIEKLLPCPFCGSKAELEKVAGSGPGWLALCTRDSGCGSIIENKKSEAIAAWNTRAYNPDDRLREALEECATALHAFILLIGKYGLKEYWLRSPTSEEVQRALVANNAAREILDEYPADAQPYSGEVNRG